jgi:hypothetical protein
MLGYLDDAQRNIVTRLHDNYCKLSFVIKFKMESTNTLELYRLYRG